MKQYETDVPEVEVAVHPVKNSAAQQQRESYLQGVSESFFQYHIPRQRYKFIRQTIVFFHIIAGRKG